MSNHTPGPWYPIDFAGYWAIQNGPYYEDVDLLDVESSANAEANANLAAAAPEVTDTLLRTYGQLLKELPMSLRGTIRWQGLLSSMRHDLAKAYGIDEQEIELIAIEKAIL